MKCRGLKRVKLAGARQLRLSRCAKEDSIVNIAHIDHPSKVRLICNMNAPVERYLLFHICLHTDFNAKFPNVSFALGMQPPVQRLQGLCQQQLKML